MGKEPIMINIIKQRNWTEPELRDQGFDHYERRKQIIMVRQLPEEEAPKRIIGSSGENLIARAGDMICYDPSDQIRPTLDDYDHWPVKPEIFGKTYREWDPWEWHPSAPEEHLFELGCKPYYKVGEVWAKKLDKPTYIQSLEQPRPELAKQGRYLVIGAKGEPYTIDNRTFLQRYYQRGANAFWKRIQQLFGGRE
jgi:hypothetical protein